MISPTQSVSTIGVVDPDEVRVLRAADTMYLGTLYASQTLVEEARQRNDLRVVRELETIEFDDGQLENLLPHVAF